MAALSQDANTDKVVITATANLTSPSAFTWLLWVYIDSLAAERFLMAKEGAGIMPFLNVTASGQVRMRIKRATTNSEFYTFGSEITTGQWWFIAATTDTGATPVHTLYKGSLTTTAALLTCQESSAGSGSIADDSANDLWLGNRSFTGTGGLVGRIGWVGIWHRVLTLGELKSQQFRPRVTSGCRFFSFPGAQGATDIKDWSGYAHHGTATSGDLASGLPIGPWFGADDYARYAVAAAAGQPFWKRMGGVPHQRRQGPTFGYGWGY